MPAIRGNSFKNHEIRCASDQYPPARPKEVYELSGGGSYREGDQWLVGYAGRPGAKRLENGVFLSGGKVAHFPLKHDGLPLLPKGVTSRNLPGGGFQLVGGIFHGVKLTQSGHFKDRADQERFGQGGKSISSSAQNEPARMDIDGLDVGRSKFFSQSHDNANALGSQPAQLSLRDTRSEAPVIMGSPEGKALRKDGNAILLTVGNVVIGQRQENGLFKDLVGVGRPDFLPVIQGKLCFTEGFSGRFDDSGRLWLRDNRPGWEHVPEQMLVDGGIHRYELPVALPPGFTARPANPDRRPVRERPSVPQAPSASLPPIAEWADNFVHLAKKEQKRALERQMASGERGASGDVPYLKSLVEAANRKHSGINLHYAEGVDSAIDHALSELAKPDSVCSRYVCTLKSDHLPVPHNIALEFRKWEDGAITAVGIDSYFNEEEAGAYLFQDLMQLSKWSKKGVSPLLFLPEVQQVRGCGVFATSFNKALWKDSDTSSRAHQLAREAATSRRNRPLSKKFRNNPSIPVLGSQRSFQVLTPAFAKHVQSETRLIEILEDNLGFSDIRFGKHANTLTERRERLINEHAHNAPLNEHERKRFNNSLSTDLARLRMFRDDIEGFEKRS